MIFVTVDFPIGVVAYAGPQSVSYWHFKLNVCKIYTCEAPNGKKVYGKSRWMKNGFWKEWSLMVLVHDNLAIGRFNSKSLDVFFFCCVSILAFELPRCQLPINIFSFFFFHFSNYPMAVCIPFAFSHYGLSPEL